MSRESSILVLNYNGKHWLEKCLPSIVDAVEYDGGNHDIVLVDNISTDDSVDFTQRCFPRVRIKRMLENAYLFSLNEATEECNTDYVLLFNNDVRVERDFLRPLLQHFSDSRVFAVMPLIESDETGRRYVYRCPGDFRYGVPGTGRHEALSGPGHTLFAHGAVAAYCRSKFLSLGGFDTLYWPGYFEDMDISWRAWMQGWPVIFEPMSRTFHYASGTWKSAEREGQIERHRHKGQTIFVLKNISDARILWAFLKRTALRLGKDVLTRNRVRLGAYRDVMALMPSIRAARKEAESKRNLSDRQILQAIRANTLDGADQS